MILSSKKKFISLMVILLTATLMLGSTFAWQSISQQALNEIRGGINPGGRLHDDFDNITPTDDPEANKTYDKDVYVENYTSKKNEGVEIYARVRLDEYMEIGTGAGRMNADGSASADNQAVSVIAGASIQNKSSWSTYIPEQNAAWADRTETSQFRTYWTWKHEGGSAVYMPTFNKNNMSLDPDVNGTWAAGFGDHEDYTVGQKKTDMALYAPNTDGGEPVTGEETHTAAETQQGRVVYMADWLNLPDEQKTGAFWVWDTDGWAYWADSVSPGEATGLLLDEIKRTDEPIGDEWYYGVNVVAQFITGDDLGNSLEETPSGFYDLSNATRTAGAPTQNALTLLSMIGVDVDGRSGAQAVESLSLDSTEVSDEAQLRAAMEAGGDITVTTDILLTESVKAVKDTSVYLGTNRIKAAPDFEGSALFLVSDGAWLDFDGTGGLTAPDSGYAVRVEGMGLLYIWNGSYTGGAGVIYVDKGEAVIVDGEYRPSEHAQGQLLDWNRSGKAVITVYGGRFQDFNPLDADGKDLLAGGYTIESRTSGSHTVYTVTAEEKKETDSKETSDSEISAPEDGEEGSTESGTGTDTGMGTETGTETKPTPEPDTNTDTPPAAGSDSEAGGEDPMPGVGTENSTGSGTGTENGTGTETGAEPETDTGTNASAPTDKTEKKDSVGENSPGQATETAGNANTGGSASGISGKAETEKTDADRGGME